MMPVKLKRVYDIVFSCVYFWNICQVEEFYIQVEYVLSRELRVFFSLEYIFGAWKGHSSFSFSIW